MKIKLVYIFCIVSILVLGCEKPPVEEMENAREAVFRAESDANAVQFAGDTVRRARDSLRRMQEEADNKRYDSAKIHAAEAITAAERAIVDGAAAARRFGEEAGSMIASLRTEIEETSRNVNGARYSLLDLDYDALDRMIVDAYNTGDQAEADHAAGRYQDAIDKAIAVRTDMDAINQMVANAVPVGKK